jgi:hypothetical protein
MSTAKRFEAAMPSAEALMRIRSCPCPESARRLMAVARASATMASWNESQSPRD